jgi:hypothetical protein
MNTLLGWLVTYLIHSTVLLGLAWLVDRLLRARPHWQELVWKVALVGGLLTATAQTTSALRPWGGTWSLEAEPPRLSAAGITGAASTAGDVAAPAIEPAAMISPPPDRTMTAAPATALEPGASPVAFASPIALTDPAEPAAEGSKARWNVRPAVLGVWAAGALLLLGLLEEEDDDALCSRAPSDEREEAKRREQDRRRRDKAGRARTSTARRAARAHERDADRGAAHEHDVDADHHPMVVRVPPLHLDIDIDVNDPHLDEQLEKLQSALENAIPSPEATEAALARARARTGNPPQRDLEARREALKELQKARKAMRKQLAELRKEVRSSIRKDMERAKQDRREAQKKLRELEVQLPEIQRKVQEAQEKARKAREKARDRACDKHRDDAARP